MKSFIALSGLFFVSSVALACPNLVGTYSIVKFVSQTETQEFPAGQKRIKVEQGADCGTLTISSVEKQSDGTDALTETVISTVDGSPNVLVKMEVVGIEVDEKFTSDDVAFNGTIYQKATSDEGLGKIVGTDTMTLDKDGNFNRVLEEAADFGGKKTEIITVREN